LTAWIKSFFLRSDQKRGLPGFSLVEMSFVLVITGMIFGSALSLMKGYLDLNKQTITIRNQEKIMSSLAQFLGRNGQLPCPARASDGFSGIAAKECTEDYTGIVPFLTLGIPESFAKDGNGNFMTYAVEPYVTLEPIPAPRPFCYYFFLLTGALDLLYRNYSRNYLMEKTNYRCKRNAVVVVLIAHGRPKNHRAPLQKFKFKGDMTCTELNQRSINLFCEEPMSQEREPFRDRVVWASRTELLNMSGIVCKDLMFLQRYSPKHVLKMAKRLYGEDVFSSGVDNRNISMRKNVVDDLKACDVEDLMEQRIGDVSKKTLLYQDDEQTDYEQEEDEALEKIDQETYEYKQEYEKELEKRYFLDSILEVRKKKREIEGGSFLDKIEFLNDDKKKPDPKDSESSAEEDAIEINHPDGFRFKLDRGKMKAKTENDRKKIREDFDQIYQYRF
jgi:type II secretory pathway pseudopilin PulG